MKLLPTFTLVQMRRFTFTLGCGVNVFFLVLNIGLAVSAFWTGRSLTFELNAAASVACGISLWAIIAAEHRMRLLIEKAETDLQVAKLAFQVLERQVGIQLEPGDLHASRH